MNCELRVYRAVCHKSYLTPWQYFSFWKIGTKIESPNLTNQEEVRVLEASLLDKVANLAQIQSDIHQS